MKINNNLDQIEVVELRILVANGSPTSVSAHIRLRSSETNIEIPPFQVNLSVVAAEECAALKPYVEAMERRIAQDFSQGGTLGLSDASEDTIQLRGIGKAQRR